MKCFIKWFCVSSGVNTTDYTNNRLIYIRSLQMNRCRNSPYMDTVWNMGKYQCIIQIQLCFRFKWFTSFYDNSSALSNFTGNTFYVFKPSQLIVYYNTQKFCIVNLQNTGSIYMNGWTLFLFTLRTENHDMYQETISLHSANLLCYQVHYWWLWTIHVNFLNNVVSSANKTEPRTRKKR